MAILRLLFAAFRVHPRAFALNLALQLGRMLIPLAPPLLVKAIFARYEAGVTLTTVTWGLILGILGISVIRIVTVVVATAADGQCKALIIDGLTRSAFRSVLREPAATPLSRPLGDVVNRLSADTLRVSDQAVSALQTAGTAVMGFVALSLMIALDWRLSLAVVVPVAVCGGVVWLSRSRAGVAYQAERNAAGEVSQQISDMTSGAVAIQLAGTRGEALRLLRESCERRRRATTRSRMYFEVLLGSTLANISAIGVGLLLLIGAGQVGTVATAADLALFMAYLHSVVAFVAMFGGHLAAYRMSEVSATRLDAVVPGTVDGYASAGEAAVPATDVAAAGGFRDLRVEHLTFIHAESGHGIRDVSFTLRRGQLMVVIGTVGAGKTTLLRALLGHLPRQGGRVLVNGEEQDVLQLPNFAYTPQRPGLVSDSVRENILAGAEDAPERVDGAVWASALELDVARMPAGVDTVVGPETGLSGGQVQRVGLARMLAQGADVQVVDDPSSSLDGRTEREVWNRMLGRPDTTCIAVTHQRWILDRADLVLALNHGTVEALGPWREVRRTSAVAQRLFARTGRARSGPVRADQDRAGEPRRSWLPAGPRRRG
ncbi:ABC transporter ATP-binding protein [Micromonospora sp. M61]|uniref:ATP-binding cassette domain-containing protein n=1 Tax=Micromonospora sp. M61 TaxID=2824890 RepID=UPI001B38DB77|nr:ABC transporter ATP-binding protein [Micromonospora sp. M61]MBQ0977922.1 ABC transporter ATP-binding protein [Micromonospora sp. M61]